MGRKELMHVEMKCSFEQKFQLYLLQIDDTQMY